jgi:hypothetical protein
MVRDRATKRSGTRLLKSQLSQFLAETDRKANSKVSCKPAPGVEVSSDNDFNRRWPPDLIVQGWPQLGEVGIVDAVWRWELDKWVDSVGDRIQALYDGSHVMETENTLIRVVPLNKS